MIRLEGVSKQYGHFTAVHPLDSAFGGVDRARLRVGGRRLGIAQTSGEEREQQERGEERLHAA